MIPDVSEDQQLRDVLIAAKRATDWGRGGNADEKLAQVAPLIQALESSLRQRRDVQGVVHQLLATVREVPIYARDNPMMGSEPLVYRWTVNKPADFDKVVMRLRAMFPEVMV